MEITIEYNRKKTEEAERKKREEEEEEEVWRRENTYGGKCPHTVTDENLGMIFCIKCGVVTEEQTFNHGGGWYGNWRPTKPVRKNGKKKAAK